jgi:hypothetical protein
MWGGVLPYQEVGHAAAAPLACDDLALEELTGDLGVSSSAADATGQTIECARFATPGGTSTKRAVAALNAGRFKDEIVLILGYDEAEIAQLEERGVIEICSDK